MPMLKVLLNVEGALKDVPLENIIHVTTPITVGVLPGGMDSGKPSIAFLFELPDGKFVFAETSLQLLQAANRAFIGKYGDLTRE